MVVGIIILTEEPRRAQGVGVVKVRDVSQVSNTSQGRNHQNSGHDTHRAVFCNLQMALALENKASFSVQAAAS